MKIFTVDVALDNLTRKSPLSFGSHPVPDSADNECWWTYNGHYLRHVTGALVTSSSSRSIGRRRTVALEAVTSWNLRGVEMTSLGNPLAVECPPVWNMLNARLVTTNGAVLAAVEEGRMKLSLIHI